MFELIVVVEISSSSSVESEGDVSSDSVLVVDDVTVVLVDNVTVVLVDKVVDGVLIGGLVVLVDIVVDGVLIDGSVEVVLSSVGSLVLKVNLNSEPMNFDFFGLS